MNLESIIVNQVVTDDNGALKIKQGEEFVNSKAYLDFFEAVKAAKAHTWWRNWESVHTSTPTMRYFFSNCMIRKQLGELVNLTWNPLCQIEQCLHATYLSHADPKSWTDLQNIVRVDNFLSSNVTSSGLISIRKPELCHYIEPPAPSVLSDGTCQTNEVPLFGPGLWETFVQQTDFSAFPHSLVGFKKDNVIPIKFHKLQPNCGGSHLARLLALCSHHGNYKKRGEMNAARTSKEVMTGGQKCGVDADVE